MILTASLLLILIVTALTVAALAKRFEVPYSIALVVAGIAFSYVPGMPAVELHPDLVFFLFLPPILAEAAYFTSWRDFVRWRRSILLLAFVLVTVTSAAVAALCVWLIPGMNWATGFVLGAIVSPPDAAAAVSILRGLRLPRRIVQVLEGESLVNDAAALTLYRFAVAAVVSGGFSFRDAMGALAWSTVGGVVIGFAICSAFVAVFQLTRDAEIETIGTFLVAYAAYVAAETVHASGVLATVTTGLYLGWRAPELFSATMRVRALAVWGTVVFLVNALVFLLIGLQLPRILAGLRGYPAEALLGWCAAVALTVIGVRVIWMYPAALLPHMLSKTIREREPRPHWRSITVVAWTGLRGVVSLAAAFALPLETDSGLPFPYRSLVLLLTFAVIVATLLLQGMTLCRLIRWLKLPEDHSSESEQLGARILATERALDRMSELEKAQAAPPAVLARVRGFFEDRLTYLRAQREIEEGVGDRALPEGFQTIAEQRLWWELARTERQTIVALRRERKIGDEAMREIEREIDLLEGRMVPHR